MDHAHPKISVTYVENAVIAALTEEKILDTTDIEALEATLLPLIAQTDRINLVIDFSDVQFLSSSALGLLIRASKRIHESRGKLKLCGINKKILEIFKITRLNEVFDIYYDRQSALQDFQ